MEDNIEAAEAIVEYIYENIMYAELNSKSDYCQCCGYSGEIKIVEDDGKLVWECPNCGNRDQHKMNVARRTSGTLAAILESCDLFCYKVIRKNSSLTG